MPSTIHLVASETLMCGLKSIPIAGKAVEVVDAVRTRRELLDHGDRLLEIEGQMTRMERRLRDLVEEEIRATLEQLGQPGLDGRMLDEEIRNLRQIQEQGWEPTLFEGLLRNSSHLEELRRNPQHYGQVLDHHDQIDPSKIHLLIDADPLRILELVPFAFAALLAHQDRGVPPARIESAADIWAFPGGNGASTAITPPPAPPIEVPGRPARAQVSVPRSASPEPFTNSLGMRMMPIPAGRFLMGSTDEEIALLVKQWPSFDQDWRKREQPAHEVEISTPFFLAAHQVTRGQFAAFVKESGYRTEAESSGKGSFGWTGTGPKLDPKFTWRTPGFDQGDDHPVVCVSHKDAVKFIAWLNEREPDRGWTYHLPTEAQWEYACRAGTREVYGGGIDDPDGLAKVGNVADASAKKALNLRPAISADDGHVYTAPVGQFKGNGWGLFDMIGNVFEWCSDWFDEGYYAKSPPRDPSGPASASSRVFRGGSWYSFPGFCRPAYRHFNTPGYGLSSLGFRLAAVQESG